MTTMVAGDGTVVPPTQDPPADKTAPKNKRSKKVQAPDEAETPGTSTQEKGNESECEDDTSNGEDRADGASDGASRNSGAEDDEDDGDPIKSQAQKAVVSAIGKMERFQAAVQFNIVGELYDLKQAVGDLPRRGRPERRPAHARRDSSSIEPMREPNPFVGPSPFMPSHPRNDGLPPGLRRSNHRIVINERPPRFKPRRRSPLITIDKRANSDSR
jgi:hypothetical protein